jgi:hypothetical protein
MTPKLTPFFCAKNNFFTMNSRCSDKKYLKHVLLEVTEQLHSSHVTNAAETQLTRCDVKFLPHVAVLMNL